jgi:hypothetical protein
VIDDLFNTALNYLDYKSGEFLDYLSDESLFKKTLLCRAMCNGILPTYISIFEFFNSFYFVTSSSCLQLLADVGYYLLFAVHGP